MKNKKTVFLFACVFSVCFVLPVFTQDGNFNISSVEIMLARSSADYRVTPGDVYTLSYAAGTAPITYIISVDSSYRIRVSNLGVVNGAGKTFMQLKNEVETIVSNNYPLSGVQLVLTQPAIFKIYVNGEVKTAGEVTTWGLNRLSSLASANTTAYTSIRDVSVRSANGQTRIYDLFKAQRLGDISQDPYLRPGDTVTFNRTKRVVTINGAVERPGTYQLLDEENINELIEFYGSGLTTVADKTRVEMVRLTNSEDIAGDKIFLTEDDFKNNFALEHYDAVTVPQITQLQPVMFVEGAISNIDVRNLSSSNRLVVRFNSGETYASLLRRNINWFTEVSDTQNAYILRNEERIPLNLNSALFDSFYRIDILVQENDVLIVPFRQYFVTVAGAVRIPGRYPYIPDRDWSYYIGLAGGFIPGANSKNTVTIVDFNGKQQKKTDIITPETIITAETNHFLYYFNQYAPVITTALSLAISFFTVYSIIQNR